SRCAGRHRRFLRRFALAFGSRASTAASRPAWAKASAVSISSSARANWSGSSGSLRLPNRWRWKAARISLIRFTSSLSAAISSRSSRNYAPRRALAAPETSAAIWADVIRNVPSCGRSLRLVAKLPAPAIYLCWQYIEAGRDLGHAELRIERQCHDRPLLLLRPAPPPAAIHIRLIHP